LHKENEIRKSLDELFELADNEFKGLEKMYKPPIYYSAVSLILMVVQIQGRLSWSAG